MIVELVGPPGIGKTFFLKHNKIKGIRQNSFFFRIISKILYMVLNVKTKSYSDKKVAYKLVQYKISTIIGVNLIADEALTQYMINRVVDGTLSIDEAICFLKKIYLNYRINIMLFHNDNRKIVYQRLIKRNTNSYSKMSFREYCEYCEEFYRILNLISKGTKNEKNICNFYNS